MPNKFRYPTSGSSTRPVAAYLTATKTIGAASLTVNVSTGWTTGDIDILVFRKTSTSSSTRPEPVPGTITSWQGNHSGGTVSSLVLRAGTDQEYPSGELSVVMVAPTAAWGKDLIDGLAESHNLSDGSMKANLVLTTPKIDTINENTAANGVTIDSLNIKDGKLNTNNSVVTTNITDSAVTASKIDASTFPASVYTSTTSSWSAAGTLVSTSFSFTNGKKYLISSGIIYGQATGSDIWQVGVTVNSVSQDNSPRFSYTNQSGVSSTYIYTAAATASYTVALVLGRVTGSSAVSGQGGYINIVPLVN